MTVIPAPYGTKKTSTGVTVPRGKPVVKPVDKYNPNRPLDFGTGTGAAYRAAAQAAASKEKTTTKSTKRTPNGKPATPGTTPPSTAPQTAVPSVPAVSALTPEDLALQTPTAPNNPGYGQVGNGGTNLAGQFDPMSYAKGMAGQQYDPQITAMAQRIKGIINALPGSLDSLHKAFANIDAQNAAPAQIGTVGGGTAASNAYQAQTAGIQNQASASQAAGAASREADWAERIKLISGANVNDLRGQLGGLQAGKADAQVGYYNQGIKTKSDLVSQAIANINSIRASNDADALTQGNLTGQGLKNQAQALANTNQNIQNTFAPYQENQALVTGAQGVAAGNLSLKQAQINLKQLAPNKTLADATTKGGPQAVQALTSLIIPQGGLVQTPTGYLHVNGDPNTWLKNGVGQVMRTLPNSKRGKVVAFVKQQIDQAISPAGGWTYKNGRYVRPK